MELGKHRVCGHGADLIVRSPCVCIVWFHVLTRGNYETHSRFAVLTRPSSCSVVSKERQKLAGAEVGLVFGARTGERDGVCRRPPVDTCHVCKCKFKCRSSA